MIEFTKGDMFAVDADARVNTVNTVGVMGAGVALAFKNRYPEMFADYKRACKQGLVRPGELHIWKNLTGDWVINFPTKRDWREPSRYKDIDAGLKALREYLISQGPVSVTLPALGCGHGGLEWQKVSKMIVEALADLDARVMVFEPQDSLNVARASRTDLTDEQLRKLEHLGFHQIDRTDLEDDIHPLWVSGHRDLLKRNWIAVLPSKDPTPKEISALDSIAKQLAKASAEFCVAMIYNNNGTHEISRAFLNHGISVVLILPFGPLTRPTVARSSFSEVDAPHLWISTAGGNEPWSRPALAESNKYLTKHAKSAILADPSPGWLTERALRNWRDHPFFYIFYGTIPENEYTLLKTVDARPITRRADDGEPNISALLGNSKAEGSTAKRRSQLKLTLERVTGSQLQAITDAVRSAQSRHPRTTFEVRASIALEMQASDETRELQDEIRRIIDRENER